MRVRQIVQAANFNRFHRAGLSATQFMTLNVIPENGMTLSDLARKLSLSPSSLKKTIDSLVDRGLVVRKPSPSDARKSDILSTSKGRKLQNSAAGDFHTFMASLFAGLSSEEQKGLLAGLERLVEISALREPTDSPEGVTRAYDAARPAKRKTARSHPP